MTGPLAVELFAGAGGAALGLRAAGFEAVACVDVMPDAVLTLQAAGLPGVWSDLSCQWSRRHLVWDVAQRLAGRPLHLLWASPPCQPWSTAGKRKGEEDHRDGWPWTLDLLNGLRAAGCAPAWFLAENVAGMADRRGLPTLERIVAELGRRFAHAGWWLLDAADFGVPQHRRRVIVWAGPERLTPPHPTHGEAPVPWLGIQRWVSCGEALGFSPGHIDPERGRGMASRHGARPLRDVSRPAETVRARTHGASPMFIPLTDEPSTTIPATPGGNALPEVVYPRDGSHGRAGTEPWRLGEPAPTVTGQESKGTRASAASDWSFNGGPDRASDAAFLATGRRRLTPEECARLQDFPADHPWQARTKADLYRLIGNAVPPRLAEVVGQAMVRRVEA